MPEETPPRAPGTQPGGKFFEPAVKGGEPGNLVPQSDPGTGGPPPALRPPGVSPGKQFFGHPASGGVSTDPDPFTITPNSDRTSGGEAFTITGIRFDVTNGATVTFGGVAATSVVVVSPTQITGISPALAEGVYDVVVTNFNGQFGTLVQAWTVLAGHIIALTLVRGLTTGGTQLTIKGVNFVAGSTVRFGGILATGVIVIDSSNIYAVTPAHTRGVVDVTITEPGGSIVTGANMFTYSDAVFGGDIRRQPSVTIDDTLNNGRKTCTFVVGGAGRNAGAAPVGKEKVVFSDAGTLIFVGQVDTVVQSHESRPDNLIWTVTATDLTSRFNRKRPFGTYVDTSATVVARDLITRFAPEFNSAFVQANLPKISMILTGDLDMATVFTNISLLIGEGHWYVDFFNSIHLFALPTALGNTNLVPPATAVAPPPGSAMIVTQSTTSTLGMAWVPGWYTFQALFFYAGFDPAGPNAKTYDQASEALASAFNARAQAIGAVEAAPTRNAVGGALTKPLQFSVNYGPPVLNAAASPSTVAWLQLSREGATRNLIGDIPNGSYEIGPLGWIGFDNSGNVLQAPFPAPDANNLYFASASVWSNLEGNSGGASSPAIAAFEGAPGPISQPLFLSAFLPSFASIPIGPTVGGRLCTARKILFTRLADASKGGGTPTTGYTIINDNTTTGPITLPLSLFQLAGPVGATTPPTSPAAQMTLADSGTTNDLTPYPGIPGVAGNYAAEVTGVYQDGTESLGTSASNVAALTDSTMATLSNIPIFPSVNTVPCVYRKVYLSKVPTGQTIPDFAFDDTACVLVILDNTSIAATFTFGGNITGGNNSPPNLPPGAASTLGPDLESPTNPVPLTANNRLTMMEPAPAFSSDTSQLRNRIFVKGKGTSISQDAAVGDTQIKVADVSTFSPAGGFAIIGSRVISYYGLDAATGAGALLLNVGLSQAITQSDWTTGGNQSILPFVQVDDVASQKYYGSLELDAAGNPTDGVHEFTITDASLTSQGQLIARGLAELKQFSRPIVTLRYSTRDPLTKAGKVVFVDLDSPPIKGNFVIQTVHIDQYRDQGPLLKPRYSVFADSAARFNFNDFLLKLSENMTMPADASMAGTIDTAVLLAGDRQNEISTSFDFDVWVARGGAGTLQSNVSPMTFSMQRSSFGTVSKTDVFGDWISGANDTNGGGQAFLRGNVAFLTISRLFDITWRIRTPTKAEADMLAFPVGGNPSNQVGNYKAFFGLAGAGIVFPINTGAQRVIGFQLDQAKNGGDGHDPTAWNAVWVDEIGSNGVIHSQNLLTVQRDAILVCRLRVISSSDINTGVLEWSMHNELTGDAASITMPVTLNTTRIFQIEGSMSVVTNAPPLAVLWANHLHCHIGIL